MAILFPVMLSNACSTRFAIAADMFPVNIEAWSGWLVGILVVLLAWQQWRLYHFRQQAAKREELFRIVTENAADMIALVDVKGRRLYNSPAYEKVLGYTVSELAKTSSFEQIHQEDRFKVLEAAREANDRRRKKAGVSHSPQRWKLARPGVDSQHHQEPSGRRREVGDREPRHHPAKARRRTPGT